MKSDLDSRIDRYMNRELHPAAARALAHEALDDSNLFDELIAVALVQAALESPATTDRGLAQSALDDEDLFETLVARGTVETSLEDPAFRAVLPAPKRRRRSAMLIAAVAAVAAGLLTFFLLRPAPRLTPSPAPQPRSVATKPAAAPTILLTRDLQPARTRGSLIFRGAPAPNRAPKSEGSVVSIEDAMATVNLGSIDGLTKGTELPVTPDRQIGRIIVTTVFRDRARGKIVASEVIRTGDPVRVPTPAHLSAILQQVDALAAGGDLNAARELAQTTIAGGTPGETRLLLERLAALDYRAGAPDAARQRYEVAVNTFDQPPAASSAERAVTFANYGALSLINGEQERADDLLHKALAQAADPALRSQILNNLGATAETSGNPDEAASYYHQALARNKSRSERAVVRANLARLPGVQRP